VGAVTAIAALTGGGAFAGILVLAASTAYDYVLERGQVADMALMRSNCGVDCVNFLQQSTAMVQLKAVGYGSVGILLTDLLLLALLVAFRGGRLPLAGVAPATAADAVRSRVSQVGLLLSASLLGSAVVHAAVIPEHLEEWTLAGEFFWLLVMAEAMVGVLVVRGDRSGPLQAAAWLSLATVVLWTVSRTIGLPTGPEAWEAEPVGVADLAATSLELASLGLALVLLRSRGRLRRPASSAHVRALGLASVVAVTAIGVAGSTLPVVSAFAPAAPAHGGGGHHGGHTA